MPVSTLRLRTVPSSKNDLSLRSSTRWPLGLVLIIVGVEAGSQLCDRPSLAWSDHKAMKNCFVQCCQLLEDYVEAAHRADSSLSVASISDELCLPHKLSLTISGSLWGWEYQPNNLLALLLVACFYSGRRQCLSSALFFFLSLGRHASVC